MSDVSGIVRGLLQAEFMEDRTDLHISDDTHLIDEQVLDSLGIFLLVDLLQERFDLVVEPDEVVLENFETIAAITRLVTKKQAAKQAG